MDKRRVAHWILTALVGLALLGSASFNLMSPPELLEGMGHLGFPTWFPRWLGAWKLAGVVVLLAPGLARLKEWATAGFTISLSSAAVAHLAAGDGLGQAAPPLVLLGLVLGSWALRPADRRLG
jgi:hypothetical protein